jgi:membrane-associated phospholipid phosphatase
MYALDRELLRRLRNLPHWAWVDSALRWDSRLREHAVLWIALGLGGAAVDPDRRGEWTRAAGTIALTETISQFIKAVVRRPRPSPAAQPPVVVAPGFSFPSAHTAAAVAAGFVFPTRVLRRSLRVIAALTASSRPYLGVHYPSDVLAGAALGLAVGGVLRDAR